MRSALRRLLDGDFVFVRAAGHGFDQRFGSSLRLVGGIEEQTVSRCLGFDNLLLVVLEAGKIAQLNGFKLAFF